MKAEYRDDIVDLVGQQLRSYTEVGKGMVFGHPGHHVGGRYFCIAYQDGVALKLSQTDYDAALRLEEAEPFSPGGSPMGTWVVLTYPEAEQYLAGLPWPGNVRQLENTCRWLTVMASGREVYVEDLPPELRATGTTSTPSSDWEAALARWAHEELARVVPGSGTPLLDTAIPRFERIVIEAALARSGGRRRDASVLLGWGRNTLTRKMKELDMNDAGD